MRFNLTGDDDNSDCADTSNGDIGTHNNEEYGEEDRTMNTGDRDVNTTDDNNEDDDDGSEDEVAMFMNGTCNCRLFERESCSKLFGAAISFFVH